VRNVILQKSVCCADSDLLYISKLRPYIITWHRIPSSHNANRAVRNIALLQNTPLRGTLWVSGVQRSGDARGDCLIGCPLPNSSIEQWRMVVIVTG